MANRLFALVILALLVMTPLPLAAGSSPRNGTIKSIQNQPSFPPVFSTIELGYGPTTLSPITNGIPIFGYNDQMWILSTYNSTLMTYLYYTSPNSSGQVAQEALQPGRVSLLYSFGAIEERNWTLQIIGGLDSGNISIPISYVVASDHTIHLMTNVVRFQNGSLVSSFLFGPPSMYDVQGCLTPTIPGQVARVSVPPVVGSGVININANLSNQYAMLSVLGSISSSVVFWFELDYMYSYSFPGSSGVVSSELEVVRSSATTISGQTGNVSVSLNSQVSYRPGRYTLIAFFDNGQTLSISQTSILMVGQESAWVWLGLCASPSLTTATNMSFDISLSKFPSQLPKLFYLMYESAGVEFFSNFTLNLSVAKVNFVATPWNVAASEIGISVAASQKVKGYTVTGGALYILSSGFPVSVDFNLTFAGRNFASSSVVLQSSLSNVTELVTMSKLVVKATNEGQDLAGVRVVLGNGSSVFLSETTDSKGNATFYVPSGSYDVSTFYSGNNITNHVQLLPGQSASSLAAFSTSSTSPDSGLLLLAVEVVGAAGVIANLWVWVIRRRRLNF